MYEDFLRDMVKRAESEEGEELSLSQLVFNIWLKNKVELDDDLTVFEKNLRESIAELSNSDLKEDDDLNQILFMFGYTIREDKRLGKIGFENRIEQHYGTEFYYMELFETLSRELGTLFYDHLEKNPEVSKIEQLILYQHIRSCSIYSEVIHLIKGGFGTGALTRFRSLHESAIITEFVVNNGETAAESYFDYLPVMQKKDIIFEEKITGLSIVDRDYDYELQERLSEIEKRRGKEFVNVYNHNDYVWAKEFLVRGGRPSFNQIRKAIQRDHGIKPYKIASNNIHSAPRSLTSSLSTKNGEVSGGASNIGLSLPGTWATYEMLQMNRLIFTHLNLDDSIGVYSRMHGMFIVKMMNHLVALLNESFPNKEESLLSE